MSSAVTTTLTPVNTNRNATKLPNYLRKDKQGRVFMETYDGNFVYVGENEDTILNHLKNGELTPIDDVERNKESYWQKTAGAYSRETGTDMFLKLFVIFIGFLNTVLAGFAIYFGLADVAKPTWEWMFTIMFLAALLGVAWRIWLTWAYVVKEGHGVKELRCHFVLEIRHLYSVAVNSFVAIHIVASLLLVLDRNMWNTGPVRISNGLILYASLQMVLNFILYWLLWLFMFRDVAKPQKHSKREKEKHKELTRRMHRI